MIDRQRTQKLIIAQIPPMYAGPPPITRRRMPVILLRWKLRLEYQRRGDVFQRTQPQHPCRIDRYIFRFGHDRAGEVYVMTSNNAGPFGNTGEVYQLVPTN